MHRLRIQWKIVCSAIVLCAWGFSLVLLGVTCVLGPWHVVEEMQVHHVAALYEIGFPLVAVFLFSQLFAEDTEEGVLKWILALPFNRWRLLTERWLLGSVMLLLIYVGSLLVINAAVVSLPWTTFMGRVLAPSVLLGHLALLVTVAGRNHIVGIAVPILYWTFECLSRGMVTKQLSLFMTTFPMEHGSLNANRAILFAGAAAAVLLSGYLLRKTARYL